MTYVLLSSYFDKMYFLLDKFTSLLGFELMLAVFLNYQLQLHLHLKKTKTQEHGM